MKINFNPGCWFRIGSRQLVIMAASTLALSVWYSHYDVWRDPKASLTIGAFVAAFDKLAHWWNQDQDADELRKIIAERDRTIETMRAKLNQAV